MPAFAIKGRGTRTTDNNPNQTHQPMLKDKNKAKCDSNMKPTTH